jgi:hypothetical protein
MRITYANKTDARCICKDNRREGLRIHMIKKWLQSTVLSPLLSVYFTHYNQHFCHSSQLFIPFSSYNNSVRDFFIGKMTIREEEEGTLKIFFWQDINSEKYKIVWYYWLILLLSSHKTIYSFTSLRLLKYMFMTFPRFAYGISTAE